MVVKVLASVLCAVIMSAAGGAAASAEEWEKYDKPVPTSVLVRVLAHGAKAMSRHTGVLVIVRDAETGREYDRGMVEGTTGDETALMKAGYPRRYGARGLVKGDKGMLDDGGKAAGYEAVQDAAVFMTSLQITKPTHIVVEAHGPLMPQHSSVAATTSTWAFPGQDIGGDGIVLELSGLIVDALTSLKDLEINAAKAAGGIRVPFYMQMLCGCPIAPKGKTTWEAEGFMITTQAYYKGKLYYEDTASSDKLCKGVSVFETKAPLPKDLPQGPFKKERVKLRIMASQPDQNNYGMDEFNVYLSR